MYRKIILILYFFANKVKLFTMDNILKLHHVGQLRTNKNKPFVIYCDKYVIKGPYKKYEENKRYRSIVYRNYYIKKWNVDFIIPSEGYITYENERYIVYPNLLYGCNYSVKSVKENFSNYTYEIVDGSELVSINKINIEEYKDKISLLVESLVKMFILGTGDMNLRNILFNKHTKNIYIVDYDDTRDAVRDDEYFYFNRYPSYKNIWNANIYYNDIADKIEKIVIEDEILKNNKNYAIKLLRKYSSDISYNINILKRDSTTSLGKMKIGLWNSITFSGFSDDIIKSGLQKYIRRDIVDKAKMCSIEMYRFGEIEGGKGKVTNLYNRLDIIACEDIGPANWPLVKFVLESTDSRDVRKLLELVELMCKSKKTRMMSWLNKKYNPLYYKSKEVLSDDTIVLNRFKESIVKKDYECFYYAHLYKDLTKNKKVTIKGSRRKNSMKFIWLNLENLYEDKNYKDYMICLENNYFTHTECNPFLNTALLSSIYWNSIKDDTTNISNNFTNDINIVNYILSIDDYVIDKHTKEGRRMGKDRNIFVLEGAKVEHQDMRFYDQDLYNLYNKRDF